MSAHLRIEQMSFFGDTAPLHQQVLEPMGEGELLLEEQVMREEVEEEEEEKQEQMNGEDKEEE